jgi:hypothetical protein
MMQVRSIYAFVYPLLAHRNTGLYNRVVWKLVCLALGALCWAQPVAHWPPRFEDYPVREKWNGPPAPLKLSTRSERMFRTRLTNAAKESPDFAGHYRFAGWGCGSACAAGAIIDLETGLVYPPPLAGAKTGWGRWTFTGGVFEARYTDYRPDSALLVVRRQGREGSPEVLYFAWENHSFRRLTPSSK